MHRHGNGLECTKITGALIYANCIAMMKWNGILLFPFNSFSLSLFVVPVVVGSVYAWAFSL